MKYEEREWVEVPWVKGGCKYGLNGIWRGWHGWRRVPLQGRVYKLSLILTSQEHMVIYTVRAPRVL